MKKVIFPEYSYEIILEILDGFKYKSINEKLIEKISKASNKEDLEKLLDQLPSRYLVRIAKLMLVENLSLENASILINEKLGLDNKSSLEMAKQIKNKIVAFSKTEDEEDYTNNESDDKEKNKVSKEKIYEKNINNSKDVSKSNDPYRESIN